MALPLQGATVLVTQRLFELAGMQLERSGNLLTINGVNVAIAEACNGMRMVFALVIVSYAFAFGTPLLLGHPGRRAVGEPDFGHRLQRHPPAAHRLDVWRGQHHARGSFSRCQRLGHAAGQLPAADGDPARLRWALIPVTRYTLAYD